MHAATGDRSRSPADPPMAAGGPAADTQPAVLELTDIWKRYPGVVALKGVSFAAAAGQVHALLGENGAGKSTLMGVAAASVSADEGVIAIDGEPVQAWTPAHAQRAGLAIV